MFEEIFFPKTAEKYRAAPLVEQRERYLVHLEGLGSTRSTLRKCANDQLGLVRLLNLQEEDRVSSHRLEAAATNWSRPKGRRCTRSASPKARTRFVGRGIEWLRFLGWLDEPEREPHPHQAEIAIFESWLCQERGLSRATIRDYCHAANRFIFWLAGKSVPLSAVRMTDIDDVIAAEHNRGADQYRSSRYMLGLQSCGGLSRLCSRDVPAPFIADECMLVCRDARPTIGRFVLKS
jgi:hypothetical protein